MTAPSTARAAADLADGLIIATVEVAAPPDRVFPLLASAAITDWWMRPGVFDTRTWSGDLRPGGRCRVSGMGGGQPYVLKGEFIEVAGPTRLAHTWHPGGQPAAASTVRYRVDTTAAGSRITLRHEGLRARDLPGDLRRLGDEPRAPGGPPEPVAGAGTRRRVPGGLPARHPAIRFRWRSGRRAPPGAPAGHRAAPCPAPARPEL